MKTTLQRILTIVFVSALTFPLLNGQNSKTTWKYGATPADSLECLKNQSLYGQYYTQNNYDLAVTFWRQNFNSCPTSSENIYVRGQKMYESFYEKTRDKAYIDTLIMIVDQKALYYGTKATADFRKVYYFAGYGQRHPELLTEAYKLVDHYIVNEPEKLVSDVMIVHMNNTAMLYRTKKLTQEEVIGNYTTLMDIVEQQIAAKPNDKAFTDAKGYIEEIFRTSGVATCDNLIPLFTDKVAANPTDIALIRKVKALLENAKCTESELYYSTLTSMYNIEKSAALAYQLAQMDIAKNNFEKAEKYYLEAVELETDPMNKSNYLIKLATLELTNKDFVKARDFAKQALEVNPESGSAYYIIGSAYMSAKIGNDDFEPRTVFWIAADYFVKAKNLDPSLTDLANENIAICAANFPKKDDAFFVGILLEEGAPYTVKGWINERTTVRYRN
jgi:tetratricopeptide (TPR) repeat protein